ncbi:MAG: hypothetical protein PHC98_04260 [Syntrophotalea acetylenica]|nr:hypothetical protein [Syntrophotalea acetylenica]
MLAAGGYPSDLTTRNEAPGMALRAMPGTPKKKLADVIDKLK